MSGTRCGSAAVVLTLSDIPEVRCERASGHDGSHAAHLPGCWQWWPADGIPTAGRAVPIPAAALLAGGRPSDWIEA